MRAMRLLAGSAIFLATATHAWPSDEALYLSELEGTYSSSILGGCDLFISGLDGRLLCKGRPVSPVVLAQSLSGYSVLISTAPIHAQVILGRHARRAGAGSSAWPPSLTDPTLPLVASSQPSPGTLLWLHPVRWGPRLYLVREDQLKGFCTAPRKLKEPRKVAKGDHFLKVGHHQKPVSKKAAPQCNLAIR